MFKYKPELSIIKMCESETVQLYSFNAFNNLMNGSSQSCKIVNDSNKHGSSKNLIFANANEDNNNEIASLLASKKYKLRLKFDGACALEVVRLNGGHFQNLTHLDISGNSAEKLDLRSLTRLEWLCCSNNNLEILVLSGISLTYLDCSHNNLQCISIDPLPNNLSTLQVSFNNLEELPVWTWIVPELGIIYASNNHLRQIDCKFQNCLLQLPIRELYIYSNKIEFISKDFIQRATRLKILNLSQNMIEIMPNFGKRCQIQELYLSRNQLQDNEDQNALDFLYDCSNIRRLYLAFNKIQHINERCLISWKNLEELILCGNRIKSLPSKLSSLPALRVLRVHSNLLETVPNLTKLSALKVVDLSHNNLRKINLENLIAGGHLTYLDISCNEKLSINLENFHSPKRQMNLIEVTQPRKSTSNLNDSFQASNNNKNYEGLTFSHQFQQQQQQTTTTTTLPPWEVGFSELPDKNQILCVAQYRDVNLTNGEETLLGLFDSGDGNPAPKSLSKSIAKIYIEEKTIDESPKFSLKYTLLNALNCMFDADRNSRQLGNTKPMQGVLCLLSSNGENNPATNHTNDADQLLSSNGNVTLNLAMIGNVRCILVETGKKIKVLTELNNSNYEGETSTTPDQAHLKDAKKSNNDANTTNSEDEDEGKSKPTNNANSNPKTSNSRNNKVIQDPITVTMTLTRTAQFLIVANANVWNYINDQELVDELDLHRHKKSVLISKRITDMAQSHSCKDSLSLILVRFKWNSSGSNSSSRNNILESNNISTVTIVGDHHRQLGPMSYISHHSGCGSSDGYSDECTNALASVTTPDSAIDTDNRSSRSSNGSATDSNQSTATSPDKAKRKLPKTIKDDPDSKPTNTKDSNNENDDDIVSLSHSISPSQMSVEQFRCWEYMLEQNTRLLFKKELDSLSKATFAKNQKLRKSVHFPFKSSPSADKINNHNSNNVVPLIFQQQNETISKSSKNNNNAGFFTLSKAKSLSHLFSTDHLSRQSNINNMVNSNNVVITGSHKPIRKTSVPSHGNLSVAFRPPSKDLVNTNPAIHHQLLPQMFNANPNHGAVRNEKQIRNTKGTIIGGPNAAYFGSVQRLIPTNNDFFQITTKQQPHQTLYEKDEIQELRADSIEHDNHRLKKYWDNKITEL